MANKDNHVLVALARFCPPELADKCAARLGVEIGGAEFKVPQKRLSPVAHRFWRVLCEVLGDAPAAAGGGQARDAVWGWLVGVWIYVPSGGFSESPVSYGFDGVARQGAETPLFAAAKKGDDACLNKTPND